MTIRTKLYLGGTFNPVHVGHARLAIECQAQVQADEFVFVPCHFPPHKPNPGLSADHRLRMVELCVAELRQLPAAGTIYQVDPCELQRTSLSYTWDTLRLLRSNNPQDILIWVIGFDSFRSLHTWHRWRELTDWANILVVNRPGVADEVPQVVSQWAQDKWRSFTQFTASGSIALIETTPLPIASSVLREQIARNVSPKFLLPESVYAYVNKHNLYH